MTSRYPSTHIAFSIVSYSEQQCNTEEDLKHQLLGSNRKEDEKCGLCLRGVERWRVGGVERRRDGRMERWRSGGMEWRDGGVEGWKGGEMEGWRGGEIEGRRGGLLKIGVYSACSQAG